MIFKDLILSTIDTQITPIIHAVQYDSDRALKCSFIDLDVSTVSTARIYAKKPDGTEVYNDCAIQGDYILAPLTSQTLAAVGKVYCQLQLELDNYLTTFEFIVIVEESLVSSSAIESSNEYTALENALEEVESVITGLPSKVSKSGDSMSGNLDMSGNLVRGLGTPILTGDATSKDYVDTRDNARVEKGTVDGSNSLAVGASATIHADNALAIGAGNCSVQADGAIQIGAGVNQNADTAQIGNYQILDANGKIPDARLNINPSNFALVDTITADGTQSSYTINLNNAKRIIIAADYAAASGSIVKYGLYNGATRFIYYSASHTNTSQARRASIEFDGTNGLWLTYFRAATPQNNTAGAVSLSLESMPLPDATTYPSATSVVIEAGTGTIPSGSKIYVYAY